jgi:CMP-N-acetylneuraminic acid synthetase
VKEQPRSLVSIDESTGKRNGAIYITRVEMLRDGLVFDDDSLKYPMPHERSLDINTPADLEEARRIAEEKGW